MRRLVLVAPVPPPPGGIASHVASLARALARRGVPHDVVDPRDRIGLAAAAARAAAGRALAHVHVSGHNRPSWILAAAFRAPILSLHSGLLPAWAGRLGGPGRAAVRVVLGRAGAIVCVSDAVAEAAVALGAPRYRVVVASPFVPEGLAPGAPPAAVEALRAAGRRVLAAAVAPGAEYGADVLVDGFARLAAREPRATLVVFGPDGADRAVAASLAARGLGARVVATGPLGHAAALGVLRACDLFLRPTRADGDALSIREALALGRPVVASDAAARPPGAIIVPADDAAALAAAAGEALGRPPPRPYLDGGLAVLMDLYRASGLEVSCAASPDA